MNRIRMITIALPVTLLLACGGGGGGGGGAVAVNPLTTFVEAEDDNPTIQAVVEIAGEPNVTTGVDLLYSDIDTNTACPADVTCFLSLPGDPGDLIAGINPMASNSFIFFGSSYFAGRSFDSRVTPSVNVNGATIARGRVTATRATDDAPLTFETFAGWLDDSFFSVTHISIGDSDDRQYRFASNLAGIPATQDPSGTGSATWEGVTVATIKANRTFIRGDATIIIPDLANPDVAVTLDDWRNLDNQAVSSVSAISYQDLTLTNGSFEGSGNDQVEGRFYGTGHTEVGGFFNTETVTGAFGGTRQ